MSEASLKTQASKNRIYVQPSACTTWTSYPNDNPRTSDESILCLNDILDGRLPPSEENDEDYYNHSIGPTWAENDGVNIIGTPLGSLAFVKEYNQSKLQKHKLSLYFIANVAKMDFSRVAHKMITGFAVPRLTHILKTVTKDTTSTAWMQSADDAHFSTWLQCVGAETLDTALQATE
jgi:hypothetical protein